MADSDDFNELLLKIQAVENPEEPSIPVEVMTKEGMSLYSWAQKDKSGFDAVNFDWNLVTELPKRISALRYAEVCWGSARTNQAEAQSKLNKLRPEVKKLFNDALSSMEYAFDKNPKLLGRVSEIRGGTTLDNFVIDCTATQKLAMEGKALLDSINYDFKDVNKLAEMAGPLGLLVGEADMEKLSKSEEKVIRDKAYTYCRIAIDEIRKCGKYVNRKNPKGQRGYTSAYLRKLNRKYNANKKKNAQAPKDNKDKAA